MELQLSVELPNKKISFFYSQQTIDLMKRKANLKILHSNVTMPKISSGIENIFQNKFLFMIANYEVSAVMSA